MFQSVSSSASSLLEIRQLLSDAETNSSATTSRNLSGNIDLICKRLENQDTEKTSFSNFLSNIHDHLIQRDSSVRTVLLRTVRYSIKNAEICELVLTHDIHYVIVSSLEKDPESMWERMQALKIMRKAIELCPSIFPPAFTRSLVAIASCKDDNFRRVCLETLRELSIKNAKEVYEACGFRVLFDAVLDHNTKELAEPILLSMLYLLNDASSRVYIRPYLDLEYLLYPFTDIDTSSEDINQKWQSAKSALVIMMRSWVGVVELSSDDMGFASLVRMLCDPKISVVVKELILDCISEICYPIVSKLEFIKAFNGAHVLRSASNLESNTKTSNMVYSNSDPSFVDEPTTTKRTREVTSGKRRSDSIHDILNNITTDDEDDLTETDSPELSALSTSPGMQSNLPGGRNASRRSKAKLPGAPRKRLSVWTRFTSYAEIGEKITIDPVFNLMDNYAGLICSAFLHVGLFDSLCLLCTHGDSYLSNKSKVLLVDLMGVVAKVFPERVCCEIMTTPSLVQYAASIASLKTPDKAHKSFELIIALANAFSVTNSQDLKLSGGGDYRSFSVSSFSGPSVTVISRASKRASVRSISSNGNTSPNKRSNKPSIPSMSIAHVCNDMVRASCSAKMWGDVSGTRAELIHEMKLFLNSDVDRNELTRRTEVSKVVSSKEGKEPFKWDWAIVLDILDYLSQHHERLNEILKTKFIRRICGFYRCSLEEKAFFCNMEWDPIRLHYLECACTMYAFLVDTDIGLSYLDEDRRGKMFLDIVKEFDELIQNEVTVINGVNSAKTLFNRSINVFRPNSMSRSMTREYFCLIGRLCATPSGRKYFETNSILIQICNFGVNKVLDYISRVAITSLGFTDTGYMTKNLMQLWTKQDITSKDLCLYCFTLLHALLRSRTKEYNEWSLELLIDLLLLIRKNKNENYMELNYIPNDNIDIKKNPLPSYLSSFSYAPVSLPLYIINCIQNVCQDRIHLKNLILRDDFDATQPGMENLLLRYFALPEGFRYINGYNLVDKHVQLWRTMKCEEYGKSVDISVSNALNSTYLSKKMSSTIVPITIPCPAFSHHPSAQHGDFYPDGGVDIEGLLRLPWNIDIRVVAPSGSLHECEPIRLDTYFESSNLHNVSAKEAVCDVTRLVKIRGIVTDSRGLPSSIPISNDRTIMSALFCGVCPVTKDGRLFTSANDPSYIPPPMSSTSSRETTESPKPKTPASTPRRPSLVASTSRVTLSDPFDRTVHIEPVVNPFDSVTEWTTCKPSHRQKVKHIELVDRPGMFSIEITGEPVVWIFNRQPKNSSGNNSKNQSSVLYLEEVHYVVRLETGQSTFLPLPSHLYGEMARTGIGIKTLMIDNVIQELLGVVNSEEDEINCSTLRGAVWSLGHICSTEIGIQAVLTLDSNIIKRLVCLATASHTYTIRSAAFSALGLVSRSETGCYQLNMCQWDCAPFHHIAVAVPRRPSDLFTREHSINSPKLKKDPSIIDPVAIKEFVGKVINRDDMIESDIINCIAKLPGQIMYNENFAKLSKYKKDFPKIFDDRSFFLAVNKVLAHFSFKLSIRRQIINMFSPVAKKISSGESEK